MRGRQPLYGSFEDMHVDIWGPRGARGTVWVFDPQQVAQEGPTWWWNPLSYVTDVARARKPAEHFASGSRDADASTDAYFDPAGRDLLANLLLAAATAKAPITQVYSWHAPYEFLRAPR
ncbi:hypothetical protein [Streptomyces sp. fd1-xmd]|uniref:hypothetical protein n=1 Tax=Streptomyces sp. fd1-xmd TaxID=1812480 RepID=UPI001CECCABC|nr:hypothetical protein [Streptomyces sp. fd1-xmd]